jgi:hypothetical protein
MENDAKNFVQSLVSIDNLQFSTYEIKKVDGITLPQEIVSPITYAGETIEKTTSENLGTYIFLSLMKYFQTYFIRYFTNKINIFESYFKNEKGSITYEQYYNDLHNKMFLQINPDTLKINLNKNSLVLKDIIKKCTDKQINIVNEGFTKINLQPNIAFDTLKTREKLDYLTVKVDTSDIDKDADKDADKVTVENLNKLNITFEQSGNIPNQKYITRIEEEQKYINGENTKILTMLAGKNINANAEKSDVIAKLGDLSKVKKYVLYF